MRTEHLSYWALTGTLMGVGVITFDLILISWPCLLVGLGLILYGVIRFGIGGFWAALLSFGVLSTLIFVLNIVSAPPPCPPSLTPIQAACGYLPPSYTHFAELFGTIALLGLIGGAWSLFRRIRTRYEASTR